MQTNSIFKGPVPSPLRPISLTPVETQQSYQDFKGTFASLFDSVNNDKINADNMMQKVATGQSSDLHGAMIALEKADLSMQFFMQTRNKIIEAYQEIARMPI